LSRKPKKQKNKKHEKNTKNIYLSNKFKLSLRIAVRFLRGFCSAMLDESYKLHYSLKAGAAFFISRTESSDSRDHRPQSTNSI
jgi:hypothetical protein